MNSVQFGTSMYWRFKISVPLDLFYFKKAYYWPCRSHVCSLHTSESNDTRTTIYIYIYAAPTLVCQIQPMTDRWHNEGLIIESWLCVSFALLKKKAPTFFRWIVIRRILRVRGMKLRCNVCSRCLRAKEAKDKNICWLCIFLRHLFSANFTPQKPSLQFQRPGGL